MYGYADLERQIFSVLPCWSAAAKGPRRLQASIVDAAPIWLKSLSHYRNYKT
jgi:hypothetical protein